MTIIDISAWLTAELPVWPTSPGWTVQTDRWDEGGDGITNSTLRADMHVGTHVEAPRHFLRDGATLDELPLDVFVGPAYVADMGHAAVIDADALATAGIPDGTVRLLFRTTNSGWWPASRTYRPDYVALDETAAEWCADHHVRLVGIDYMSVQASTAGPETHRILMRAGIAILEGLDLGSVAAGHWDLICLPLPVVGVEAAPARAVLRPPKEIW